MARRTPRTTCSPADKRWRPRSTRGPVCGYRFRTAVCAEKGTHHCKPRADRVVAFFAGLLVHTKGRWARQAFKLEPWQEHEIIRPLFGEVAWSTEWRCYARRYRIAYIVLGRKNGKSEIAAGIALYMLVGDDEEAAEVYGAAKDTKQARKVWEPAERMRTLSPKLNSDLGGRLGVNKNERRIFDLKTGSYYEIITSDAEGELGHNPHLFVIDEVLSQADDSLFNAMRTAMGTRVQPLLLAITTETNNPAGFGAHQIDEAERVELTPSKAPHVFAYVRKTPMEADPWDEKNWYHANPALGSFLSLAALREEALDAKNDPTKENSFRQFRLNQRVSQVTRWMPLHIWDAQGNVQTVDPVRLHGRPCYAGLDLASTTDLAAWALFFPAEGDEPHEVLWQFWTPEAQIPFLDKHTAGMASVWRRQGLLNATEGDWIDYEDIHRQITQDHGAYRIVQVGYDQKEATATAQFMQGLGLDIYPVYQGFALSGSLKELMRLTKSERLRHGGHPVARWNADSAEVRQDDQERIKLVKPTRQASGKRIDGIAALANAIKSWRDSAKEEPEPWFAFG
jgi:phage terminase large subunit-like protein